MSENISFKKEDTQDNYASERVDVIKNKLLGDYNDKGNYVISEKIMNELILINKVKTNSYGSSVFCAATLENHGEITFEIAFKKNSKLNVALAEIYVLESVEKVNGYIYNTIKTPIGKFTDKISDDFVSRSFLMFNITQTNANDERNDDNNDDDSGKEYKEIEAFNAKFIETRMSFLSSLSKLTEKDYEKAYENYFNKRLNVLKIQNSLYANTILNTFNHEYSKIEKFFLLDRSGKIKFKTLNELLDKAFEDVNGTKKVFVNDEIKYKQKVETYMKAFVENVHKYEENATQQIISQTKDENVKSELREIADDRKLNSTKDANKVVEITKSASSGGGGGSYSFSKDYGKAVASDISIAPILSQVNTQPQQAEQVTAVKEGNSVGEQKTNGTETKVSKEEIVTASNEIAFDNVFDNISKGMSNFAEESIDKMSEGLKAAIKEKGGPEQTKGFTR